jgi:HSP20 family protein
LSSGLVPCDDSPTVAHFSFIQPAEWGDVKEDVRQLFDQLASTRPPGSTNVAGTCRPLCDVFETDDAIELVVDACGVSPASLRILFREGVVVVAGEKLPPADPASHTYHLVERDFGRFARVVRLAGAFDLDAARARLQEGQLTVVLPKRPERRGRAHAITISPDHPASA